MTSTGYAQLVAYLKSMAAKNKGENVQTNQQAAGGGVNNALSFALKKAGPKALKWGYGALTQPAAAAALPEAATIGGSNIATGAGTAGGYGTAAATTGAAAFGEGGVGMTAGGWASVAAPLLMAYLKHQAGSGVNEPLYKQQQTHGSGRMLSDMIAGKKIDPNTTLENYGIRPRTLPSYLDPNSSQNAGENYTPGTEMIDPRGYGAYDLYDSMHSMGSGRYQTGGVGNSGYNDQQIDDMFRDQKGGLAKLLGVGALPDWKNRKLDDGANPGEETPWSVGHQQVKSNEGWAKVDPNMKSAYAAAANLQQSESPRFTNEELGQQLWQQDQEQAELEKMLGRKFKRKMAVQDPNAENMMTNY